MASMILENQASHGHPMNEAAHPHCDDVTRRAVLAGLSLIPAAAPALAFLGPPAYALSVYQDHDCSCRRGWLEILRNTGHFRLELHDRFRDAALKHAVGVPLNLASCHTASVEGYVIEGNVPSRDIIRLLQSRPSDVRGLALPGMPLGSPGMEHESGIRQAYDVIAFRRDGTQQLFARYQA